MRARSHCAYVCKEIVRDYFHEDPPGIVSMKICWDCTGTLAHAVFPLDGRQATSHASLNMDNAMPTMSSCSCTPFSAPLPTLAMQINPVWSDAISCCSVLPVCFFHLAHKGSEEKTEPIWEALAKHEEEEARCTAICLISWFSGSEPSQIT